MNNAKENLPLIGKGVLKSILGSFPVVVGGTGAWV